MFKVPITDSPRDMIFLSIERQDEMPAESCNVVINHKHTSRLGVDTESRRGNSVRVSMVHVVHVVSFHDLNF